MCVLHMTIFMLLCSVLCSPVMIYSASFCGFLVVCTGAVILTLSAGVCCVDSCFMSMDFKASVSRFRTVWCVWLMVLLCMIFASSPHVNLSQLLLFLWSFW